MSTSKSNPGTRDDFSAPPKTKLIRIPPYHYLHVLDRNTNVTRLVVGPQTFVCKEHERLVFGPEKMVIVPPRHYCIIANPAVRSKPEALQQEEEEQKLLSKKDKKVEKKVEPQAAQIEEHQDRIRNIIEKEQATRGDVEFGAQGQAVLLHGEKEIRFNFDEPFPLYPGEILEGQIRPLQIVQANTALLLRANIDFQDKFGLLGPIQRKAGEQWLWHGPSTYYPQIEVDIISTVNSVIIKPNQALRLKAERECLDYNNVKRRPGEQWLVRREGAYLPNACESVVGLVDAIVLTEKVALHLRALQSFTDELNKERKVGEEWLVTHKDKETHIPEVYEQVVARVELTSLSNREYCCIRDPIDENNVPQLGLRKLVVGVRQLFMIAKSGFLPSFFTYTTPQTNTPIVTLAIGTIIGSVMNLTFYYYSEYLIVLQYVLILSSHIVFINAFIAYLFFRKKYMSLPRSFTSPLGVWGAYYGIVNNLFGFVSIFKYSSRSNALDAFYLLLVFIVSSTIFYWVYLVKRQTFSAEEKQLMFKAYLINANREKRGRMLKNNRVSNAPSVTTKSAASDNRSTNTKKNGNDNNNDNENESLGDSSRKDGKIDDPFAGLSLRSHYQPLRLHEENHDNYNNINSPNIHTKSLSERVAGYVSEKLHVISSEELEEYQQLAVISSGGLINLNEEQALALEEQFGMNDIEQSSIL